MTLLARNVAENCGRTSAAATATDPVSYQAPLPAPRENNAASGSSEAAATAATGRATSSPQRTIRKPSFAGGKLPSPPPPSPPPPPSVQGLRWGHKAQLAEALANFNGVGPDIVLA